MARIVWDLTRRDRSYEGLSDSEKGLHDWAVDQADDVLVVFETVTPSCEPGDPEWFEPFDSAVLGVEQRMPDGRIASQFLQVSQSAPSWTEQYDHLLRLAYAGLARVIEENESPGHGVRTDRSTS